MSLAALARGLWRWAGYGVGVGVAVSAVAPLCHLLPSPPSLLEVPLSQARPLIPLLPLHSTTPKFSARGRPLPPIHLLSPPPRTPMHPGMLSLTWSPTHMFCPFPVGEPGHREPDSTFASLRERRAWIPGPAPWRCWFRATWGPCPGGPVWG